MGSLFNLPNPSPAKIKNRYQSKNTGGKHRKKLLKRRSYKQQFLNLKTSTLDDIPMNGSMARNGTILVSGLKKQSYKDLIEETKQKAHDVRGSLGDELADFVLETGARNLPTIDLTNDIDDIDNQSNDIDDDDDDDDIEILSNGNKNKMEKKDDDIIVIDSDDDETSRYVLNVVYTL